MSRTALDYEEIMVAADRCKCELHIVSGGLAPVCDSFIPGDEPHSADFCQNLCVDNTICAHSEVCHAGGQATSAEEGKG